MGPFSFLDLGRLLKVQTYFFEERECSTRSNEDISSSTLYSYLMYFRRFVLVENNGEEPD